jgi:hypothetical protein
MLKRPSAADFSASPPALPTARPESLRPLSVAALLLRFDIFLTIQRDCVHFIF